LETTGLADPAPIVYTVQTNNKLSENYFIDSIVCLADCKHLPQHLDEVKPDGSANEAQQQVAFADKILLNKIDLVTKEEKEALEKRLAHINKFATVIETERSRAPLDKILGLNSFVRLVCVRHIRPPCAHSYHFVPCYTEHGVYFELRS
jgi:G3E family GTPase